jgi:hypothetical protein
MLFSEKCLKVKETTANYLCMEQHCCKDYLRTSNAFAIFGGSPCHQSMARPRVGDGRDGLQHWSLAANILNKQTRTNDKEWSSNLGVARGANNPSP